MWIHQQATADYQVPVSPRLTILPDPLRFRVSRLTAISHRRAGAWLLAWRVGVWYACGGAR